MHLTDILIVDDHPMTVDSYVSLLAHTKDFSAATFTKAYSCGEAYRKIKFLKAGVRKIQLAILDINLPAYAEAQLYSGIDLALFIRKEFPLCKILLVSMRSEPVLIDQIIQKVNPEGFVCKNDINFETFPNYCSEIIQGTTIKSVTIQKAVGLLFKKNIHWDAHDSQILLLIAEGVKTIDLPDFVPLSMSAIEKRKATIKRQLLKGKGSDKELVHTAKSLGLIWGGGCGL